MGTLCSQIPKYIYVLEIPTTTGGSVNQPDNSKEPTQAAEAGDLPEHLRWKGSGPMPRYWYAEDGTKVYRSYADYVDD